MARRLRHLIFGHARSITDRSLFHSLSLVALMAWVGLGVDGLSSSCYGPQEAYLHLDGHSHLGLLVGVAIAITVLVISASYLRIIDLFPSGGGGYLVASKLLSPYAGMVSGCALLIDYVLTITVSLAAGADQIMSLLPPQATHAKLYLAVAGVVILMLLNLRGVRESVLPLVPVFVIFLLTHVFAIVYALIQNGSALPTVLGDTAADIRSVGLAGTFFIVMRAYSMGAGTFTGIEAVSNGLPILREPRVQTAKKTMWYMAISLAFVALGLMVAYVLLSLRGQELGNLTLNALLFTRLTEQWGTAGWIFVIVALSSEAVILFVAAQTGYLGGPRVLANMALDRWMPTRFALLSDRMVTENGVLLMGLFSLGLMVATHGEVRLLVILYSINVFITFVLSQLGMVRHWWLQRQAGQPWRGGMAVNATSLALCSFILITIVVLKFGSGGWVTILITGGLVTVSLLVRRHYKYISRLLGRLETLTKSAEAMAAQKLAPEVTYDSKAKTAVLLVSGFNGVGLHSLYNVRRFFGDTFRNYVFMEVGAIDAGNFKGAVEVTRLRLHTKQELEKYVEYCRHNGFFAESFYSVGVEVVEEICRLAPTILAKYPDAVFFGGQLVFPQETALSRWLHNAVVFAVQRRFYTDGVPFVILPIRVSVPKRTQRTPAP